MFPKIILVRPSSEFKESFLQALAEFQAEKLPWVMDTDIAELRENFSSFVDSELKKRTLWTKDEPVDVTELWAILEGEYVGRISIRHKLNADLQIMGGHIGYDTRPTCRGRGIASAMLSQALPIAKTLGIREALLTCNDDNKASIRIIEKTGGVLRETKLQYESGPLKRYYWITL